LKIYNPQIQGQSLKQFLLMVCAAGYTLSTAENMLVNSDFEKGLEGWSTWGGALSAEAHTGKSGVIVNNKDIPGDG
jgi:hypothetical protein